MPKARPKVFLSDDPVLPQDVLPNKIVLDLGGAEEEHPFNPIPKRPPDQEPDPNDEPDDDEAGEPEMPPRNPDEIDDEPDEEEDAESPAPKPENPAALAADAAPPPMTPRLGSEYSAPVPAASPSPPPTVTYRSRISVLEAWRYPGQLAQAPSFISRDWAAWVDGDIYGGSSGPALRIPIMRSLSGPLPPDGCKFCRIGDYVVRQMVTLVDGLEPEESLDVWPKDAFERLFMPVSHGKKAKTAKDKSLANAA